MTSTLEHQAMQWGYKARLAGLERQADCPYIHSGLRAAWRNGWNLADKESRQ
jgi:ribosome modulation factor